MVISNGVQKLRQILHLHADEFDFVLDRWIREALLEEALAQPSPGAWERLRMALDPRRTNRYGMWVLDEPLRDPPESLPTALTGAQFQRAQRLYIDSRPNLGWQCKDSVFTHSLSTFSILLNL